MSLVLRATNKLNFTTDLDLRQDVDMRLDISAIENTDIGRVFGVSTQTFALPATKKNNNFFGNLYNLGATPAVALKESIDIQLLSNGIEVMTGKMYVIDVITNQQGRTYYNVNIVNETIDFKFQLENADNPYLSGLDWSRYTHDFTYNSITGSWNDEALEGSGVDYPLGSIIYPHINYGQLKDSNEPAYAFGGQVGNIDNASTPLAETDFKPAIRVKDVVDRIFESVDYEYSSSFFNSAGFEDLYLLTTPDDTKGIASNPVSQSLKTYNTSNYIISPATTTTASFGSEVYDNGNNWDNTAMTYTANGYGFYRFATQITWDVQSPGFSAERVITLRFKKNGVQVAAYTAPHQPTAGAIYLQYNDTLSLGDVIDVDIEFFTDGIGETLRINGGGAQLTYLIAEAPSTTIGNDVDMGLQFPADLTSLEFLQGLIEKFNLVIEPITGERNTLIIEPYENWLDGGEIKDWTDKVDRNINFSIKHPITEQPKTIRFSDVDDDDTLNVYHKNRTGRTFGEYTYSTDSDLASGERTIGKVFSPTPTKGIDGGNHFIIPQLCKRDDVGDVLPFKFKPRLLQRIGLKDVFTNEAKGIDGASASAGTYYIRDIFGGVNAHTQYFAVGSLSDVDADFSTDNTLLFNATQHYPYHQKFANGYVINDAFRQYWARYLNSELYDIDSRKLTLNVVLKPNEYFNFQLNDNIFIDGAYYRINKLSGGVLNREASVEVELIKILATRLDFKRKELGNGDIITIGIDDVNQDGYVEVVNQDGIVVSGSDIGGYLGGEGFVYRGDVNTWNNSQGNTISFSQQKQGSNQIDDLSTNVVAVGSDNLIQPSTNNFVNGERNIIEQDTINSSLVASFSSSIKDNTSLSTIVAGNESYISGSTTSMVAGARIHLEGGEDNIVIGNGGVNQTYTIKDLQNVVVINPTRDLESIENLGGDDLPNYAYLGSYRNIGGIFSDFVDLEVSDGGNTSLTGDDAKDTYTYFVDTSGSSPFTTPHEIHLPSTSAGIPPGGRESASGYKRELRFIVKDTSLQNGDVRLVPSGSDTINGTIFWNIGGAYSTLSIYGRDGAWYLV